MRHTDPLEERGGHTAEPAWRKTSGTLRPATVSTKLRRIAELAQRHPERVFNSLAHCIDEQWLMRAYRHTRKGGAAGVDAMTAEHYSASLEENLASLLARLRDGSYRAPPVRRVLIPKGDGRAKRPLGIPTFEDKVLQKAIAMLLEAIHEQDFLNCSFGFRPGRSAHDALEALWRHTTTMRSCWVLEVDIEAFFDTVDHRQLKQVLDQRIADGVIRRAIHKWLHAGVMDNGAVSRSRIGTPQGGVISPILANIFLHEVLDKWFFQQVSPRMRGRSEAIRYADDLVLLFEYEDDARRVHAVLPKRLERFGLCVHPGKTRLVRFSRPKAVPGTKVDNPEASPETFEFLGLLHYWKPSCPGAVDGGPPDSE